MTISDAQRCRGQNKRGERCGARAIERGLCSIHSGRVDAQEIGRRGGLRRPETELRQAVKQDDELREGARDLLRRALSGEDVPRSGLEAAKSLFSFRAAQPPSAHEGHEQREPSGRGSFNITDLFRWSCAAGTLSQLAKDREAEAELRQIEARVVELLPIASPAEYEGNEAA
jgi:hypothetical protein